MEPHSSLEAFKYARLLGHFPFVFEADEVVLSYKYLAWSAGIRVAVGLMLAHHLRWATKLYDGETRLYLKFVVVHNTQGYVVVTYFLAHSCFHKGMFLSLYDKLARADRLFIKLNRRVFFRINNLVAQMLLLMSFLQVGVRFLITRDMFQSLSMLYIETSTSLLVLPFVQLLNSLRKRFRYLSTLLRISGRRKLKNSLLWASWLEEVSHIHDELCSSCKQLNSFFSPQLLYIIFLIMNLVAWFAFNVSVSINNGSNFWTISLKAILIIKYTILCYVITTSCMKATDEAKEFNTLLYQLMIEDKTNDIANNKKLRLHIAMKREVVFTACGFFTLDYTLVHSMIAAATTYLVILIQFGGPAGGSTFNSSSPANSTSFSFNTTDTPFTVMS